MLLFPVTREGNICMYQDIDPVKLKTRGDFRRPSVGNYKRKKREIANIPVTNSHKMTLKCAKQY